MKKHAKNKKAAIQIAKRYLNVEKLNQFEKLKKQDDIADCILQTIWYIRNGVPAQTA